MSNQSMGLLGHKLGMTQIFKDDGKVLPVTVIEVGPCTVLQVKSQDGADGYNAVQLGFKTAKPKAITKAQQGHFAKSGATNSRYIREFPLTKQAVANFELGQVLTASEVFAADAKVDVTGTSKGRGFAGVMKRHGFKGFIRTHGTHEFFRHGGSIGTRLTPGHVMKGRKMPGHMGAERVTVQNLQVARIDTERNLLFVCGGVPGPNGGLVIVRQAVKAPR